jgi:hypothetical protein
MFGFDASDMSGVPSQAAPRHRFATITTLVSRRTRNLLLAAFVPTLIGFLGANLLLSRASGNGGERVPGRVNRAEVAAAPAASPTARPDAGIASMGRRSYAISLPELDGLPRDAAPGTRLELWVTWEPPITKAPRIQRLLRDVRLERILAAPVPEAPPTAILSVRVRGLPELLYGDKFGALSVAVPPP